MRCFHVSPFESIREGACEAKSGRWTEPIGSTSVLDQSGAATLGCHVRGAWHAGLSRDSSRTWRCAGSRSVTAGEDLHHPCGREYALRYLLASRHEISLLKIRGASCKFGIPTMINPKLGMSRRVWLRPRLGSRRVTNTNPASNTCFCVSGCGTGSTESTVALWDSQEGIARSGLALWPHEQAAGCRRQAVSSPGRRACRAATRHSCRAAG